MSKLKEKLIEEINSGKIKLKSLGKVCGKIFRLEADNETYLNITIGSLIVSGLSALGLFVIKSIAASQNMLIDGIEKSGNDYYLHGRCLDIHKKMPDMNEPYEILEKHNYDLNFLGNLNDNFENCFQKTISRIPVDFNEYNYQTKQVILKQIATWIHNDHVVPETLLQKLYGSNYSINFNSIFDIIVVDHILVEHGVDSNFHVELNEFIRDNIYNGFSISELQLLQKIDYLNRYNFTV